MQDNVLNEIRVGPGMEYVQNIFSRSLKKKNLPPEKTETN